MSSLTHLKKQTNQKKIKNRKSKSRSLSSLTQALALGSNTFAACSRHNTNVTQQVWMPRGRRSFRKETALGFLLLRIAWADCRAKREFPRPRVAAIPLAARLILKRFHSTGWRSPMDQMLYDLFTVYLTFVLGFFLFLFMFSLFFIK